MCHQRDDPLDLQEGCRDGSVCALISSVSNTQRPGGPVSVGWYRSSWVQDEQGGPLKKAMLQAQET